MNLSLSAVGAFWGELEKIAKELPQYRRYKGVLLDADVPVVRVNEKTTAEDLKRAIARVEKSSWSHPQIAVPEEDQLLRRGKWKGTRWAIPLPGEKWFTKSWRNDTLHSHKMGPVFLVHDDKHPTSGFGILKHTIDDVPYALYKRFFGKAKVPVLRERRSRGK